MPPLILIGLPGAGAGGPWLIHWNMLFARLMREYRVVCCYGMGANVYQVRNRCMPAWGQLPEDPLYMLWIDSDNLVTYEGFALLREALQRNANLDMVAGWAWTQDVMGDERPKISAGYWRDGKAVNLQYQEISEATADKELIPVEWTGLCFALIRAASLKLLGPQPFMPIPVQTENGMRLFAEDESFCHLAAQTGLQFAVHPGVKVPHLKPKPIEPEAEARINMEGSEVLVRGDLQETGEPKPEEVPT